MGDVYDVRRANLQRLISQTANGQQKLFAERVGCSVGYMSQVINGFRNLGQRVARQIENALSLPTGAMDHEAIEAERLGNLPIDLKGQIGQRIKQARESAGLTLQQLSDKIGYLQVSRISNYEHGRRTPGPDEAKALAMALGASAAYLLCVDAGSELRPPECAMPAPTQPIGERLKQARQAAGMTMEALGEAVGVTRQAISMVESGDTKDLSIGRVADLAAALQVLPGWLAFGATEPVSTRAMILARQLDGLPPDRRAMVAALIRMFAS